MRKALTGVTMTAIVLLLASQVAEAQELAGNWQGTIDAGRPLRLVFKIERASSGFTGNLYAIDQGGQPLPMKWLVAGENPAEAGFHVRSVARTYEPATSNRRPGVTAPQW
jgi:hypothetical protein